MTQSFRSKMEKTAWGIVKDLDEIHWSDLAAKGIAETTAKTFLLRWEREGRIRVSHRDKQNRKIFVHAARVTPVDHSSPVEGQTPTPEGNMWRAMRRLGSFTPTDLAAHSNAGGVEVSIEKARAYCRQLLGAQYLKVRVTAIPGKREARYSLIRDTGPLPPRTTRMTGVLDPNEQSFVPAFGEVGR
ncbi:MULTISPECIES: hypothetical protein [Salipiger]|uniref:Uncharacterized protein n=1 Tax=Salipiger profundus TaxID=1229727 RepID=A0A1U7CZN4_9RHOB|nr:MULTISPECIES: hypothetical protein [Salipiger]ALF02080.1 hypothetical protein vBThpSP1_041 [Thiobacimonas phage vB_ThpS-P1]APX21303.1 hypothetical protein Ga0080559_TMP507 [Salipiger profundus]GGA03399.1 hypothetical protein GCM10011326_13480 [Salipiger profundus]